MTAWRSATTIGGNLQVANVQSSLSIDVTVPGSGGLGVFQASAALDNRADFSSISKPVLRQVKARYPGVQVWMPLEEGFVNVRLADSIIVTVVQRTIALELTVHTP